MSKYTELQERVSNVAKELHRIKKEVKESAEKESEPKFEIGKWYSCTNGFIFRVTDIKGIRHYLDDGINHIHWFEGDDLWYKNAHPATPSEIEEYLIKEAERKGYKHGVFITWPIWNRGRCIRVPFEYSPVHNCLYDDNGYVVWDVRDGWAEIILDKKPLPTTREEYTSFLISYFDNIKDMNAVPFLDQYDFDN